MEGLGFVAVPRSADSRVTGRESSFPNTGRCSCSNPTVTAVCLDPRGECAKCWGFSSLCSRHRSLGPGGIVPVACFNTEVTALPPNASFADFCIIFRCGL